jgi:hypothetical protein
VRFGMYEKIKLHVAKGQGKWSNDNHAFLSRSLTNVFLRSYGMAAFDRF